MGCGYEVRRETKTILRSPAIFSCSELNFAFFYSLYIHPSWICLQFTSQLNHQPHRLIAHASIRYSTLPQLQSHPFFDGTRWDHLRSQKAPFVPALDSDLDTGYYDDFTSPEDMAKYEEVREKQRNVDKVREKEDEFA